MSTSNGTGRQPAARPASPYRRAAERHRAEQAAWQRIRKARIELAAAVAVYEMFAQDCPLPKPPAPVNGLVELADLHAELRDPELTAAFMEDKAAERLMVVPLEEIMEAESEADATLGMKLAKIDREKAERKEKRRAKKEKPPVPPPPARLDSWCDLHGGGKHQHKPEGGWTEATLEEAATRLVETGEPLNHTMFCSECGTLRLEGVAPCPSCNAPTHWDYDMAVKVRSGRHFAPKQRPTPSEAMAPAATAALDRLGQILDKTLPDRQPTATVEGLPPWTSEDLERELMWVVQNAEWRGLIADGATVEQIGNVLEGFWSKSRMFFPPDQTGGKLGCTVQFSNGAGYFWLGEFRGIGQKATLSGTQLIDRIRSVLKIPTPTQARQAAQASFQETTVNGLAPAERAGFASVVPPTDGWDDPSISNAVEYLDIFLDELILCNKCHHARGRTVHPCPHCKCPEYRMANWRGVDPPAEPVKRGRGRPKKAVAL